MFLHTVYSYSNAVYESLRFGTVKSDSENAFAFKNNYWKADEDEIMILQRGARGIYR
jgi:hypothetical protein